MNFNFGENLKTLRVTKGFTQEQVAELLNVSKQSISRWENNITYPDITFLPILASFYGVTVDALLGADTKTNETLLTEYMSRRTEAHHTGDVAGAFELSQELYTSFPNNTAVLNCLMTDAYLFAIHESCQQTKRYLELSISISERFLQLTHDIEEQCRCIKNIAVCNRLLGNPEKALLWLKKLPSGWSCIEAAAIDVLTDADKQDSISCSLDMLVHLFYRFLSTYADDSTLSKEQQIAVLEKLPRIFHIIFEQEDYGFYYKFLSEIYAKLANLCPNQSEEQLAYAKQAIWAAECFDKLTTSSHTSVLFQNQTIVPEEFTKKETESQTETILKLLPVKF